jgi:hypothetical protein
VLGTLRQFRSPGLRNPLRLPLLRPLLLPGLMLLSLGPLLLLGPLLVLLGPLLLLVPLLVLLRPLLLLAVPLLSAALALFFLLLPGLRVCRNNRPKKQKQGSGTGNSNELHSNLDPPGATVPRLFARYCKRTIVTLSASFDLVSHSPARVPRSRACRRK